MRRGSDEPIPVSCLLSRRRFCALGVAGVAAGVACGEGARPALTTGSVDDAGVNVAGNDAGFKNLVASGDVPDGAAGAVTTECPADGAIDAGPPEAFTAQSPTFVDAASAFVMRDAVGLYAVSATCTHQKCKLSLAAGGFVCPCHGARFTLSGSVTVGPAVRGLAHFALCLLPSGNVGVIPTMRVPNTQRLAT